MLNTRRNEAANSIMIKLKNKKTIKNLIDSIILCGQTVVKVFVLNNLNDNYSPYAFIQLQKIDSTQLSKVTHLKLRGQRFYEYTNETPTQNIIDHSIEFVGNNYFDIPSYKLTFARIKLYDDCSKQIAELQNNNKITEIGARIRSFISILIEENINKSKNHGKCICLPFGSSVSSFGTNASDLDMNISVSTEWINERSSKISLNECQRINRHQATKKIHNFADDLKQIPFIKIVDVISTTIVPIIAFTYQTSDQIQKNSNIPTLEGDISIKSPGSTFLATKILWTYANLDERVVPLVAFIRYWAKSKYLTIKDNFTTFSSYHLTMLALYILVKHEVIPPLEQLLYLKDFSSNSVGIFSVSFFFISFFVLFQF
jgi:hypothetical protein